MSHYHHEFLKLIAAHNNKQKKRDEKIEVKFEYYDCAERLTREMGICSPTLQDHLKKSFKSVRHWSSMREADLYSILTCWELASTKKDFKYMIGLTNDGYIVGDRWLIASRTRDLDGNESKNEYSNSPIELWQLDKIIEKIDPNITFLRYKNLIRKMEIQQHSNTESDYYTSSDYAYFTVKIGSILEALEEEDLIKL